MIKKIKKISLYNSHILTFLLLIFTINKSFSQPGVYYHHGYRLKIHITNSTNFDNSTKSNKYKVTVSLKYCCNNAEKNIEKKLDFSLLPIDHKYYDYKTNKSNSVFTDTIPTYWCYVDADFLISSLSIFDSENRCMKIDNPKLIEKVYIDYGSNSINYSQGNDVSIPSILFFKEGNYKSDSVYYQISKDKIKTILYSYKKATEKYHQTVEEQKIISMEKEIQAEERINYEILSEKYQAKVKADTNYAFLYWYDFQKTYYRTSSQYIYALIGDTVGFSKTLTKLQLEIDTTYKSCGNFYKSNPTDVIVLRKNDRSNFNDSICYELGFLRNNFPNVYFSTKINFKYIGKVPGDTVNEKYYNDTWYKKTSTQFLATTLTLQLKKLDQSQLAIVFNNLNIEKYTLNVNKIEVAIPADWGIKKIMEVTTKLKNTGLFSTIEHQWNGRTCPG